MEEKKKDIIEAAREMFGEYGIRSVSIDDISQRISISKKTFYQYFNNKADLVEALIRYEMDRVMEEAMKIKDEARNAIHALLLVSKLIGSLSVNRKPAAAFDLKKYYPEIFKKFTDKKRARAYDGIVMNMHRGIEEGLYRKDLSVDLVAKLYVKKIEQMHDKEFMENIDCSPASIFEVMFENHIRGISNQKGVEIFQKEKENLNFNIDDTSA